MSQELGKIMATNVTKRKRRKQDAECSNTNTTMISNTILPSDDSKDIISSFADDILSHILSFLPTKYAVATSALSKRWEHLWKSVTNLDFDDRLWNSSQPEGKAARKEEYNCFIESIDSVLKRVSRSTIHTFSLRVCKYFIYYPGPFFKCITAISGLAGLRKLSITYRGNRVEPFNLNSLFCYSSLVEFELAMRLIVTCPSITCLTNLQVLNISQIRFDIRSKEMVLNFPVLKVFRADRCSWFYGEDVILEAPLLETFIVIESYFNQDIIRASSSSQPEHIALKIVASGLRNFVYYGGNMREEIILSNPLPVVSVFLEIKKMASGRWRQVGDRLCKLLRGFRRVEELKLGPAAVEMISHADDYVSNFPEFPCLVSLITDVDSCLPSQEVLLNLLHASPILQRLEFFSDFRRFDKYDLLTCAVPQCLLSKLKDVKIKFHVWSVVETCLAKYMLENCRVLEELTIVLSSRKGVLSVKKVREELLSFHKASRILSVKVERRKLKELRDFDSSKRIRKLY